MQLSRCLIALALVLRIASAAPLVISGPSKLKQGAVQAYSASGGTGPYIFSLVSGSGGGITSGGTYTAGSSVTPKFVVGGCQATPNSSVYTTAINGLPIHGSSALWLSNMDGNFFTYATGDQINLARSTDSNTAMSFLYTPGANGPFVIPAPFVFRSQGGSTQLNGLVAGVDDHGFVVYFDNCMLQENYQLYPTNAAEVLNPGGNSQSGIIIDMESFITGLGTTAGGTPITQLQITPQEMAAAAAGDVHAFKHGILLTVDAASENKGLNIWPATSNNGATPDPTKPPYGARFRLKASVSVPTCTCSTATQNIVNALYQQQKDYGLFLTDIGTSWQSGAFGGLMSLDILAAYSTVRANIGTPGVGTMATWYDIVEECSLQTTQDQTGDGCLGTGDPFWVEAKLGNAAGISVSDPVVIKVTDNVGAVAYKSIAVQGVAVGVESFTELIGPGAVVQFNPHATGAANTSVTCSLSPSGGANGTITSGCLYTAPVSASISSRTDTVVTVTSVADGTKTAKINLIIVPENSGDGKIYISTGKVTSSISYTDSNSVKWWNDGYSSGAYNEGMFPAYSVPALSFTGPWTGANAAVAQGIFTGGAIGSDTLDTYLPIRVTPGLHSVTVYMSNSFATVNSATGSATSSNSKAFSMDCNGVSAVGLTDVFTIAAPAGTTAFSESCSATAPSGSGLLTTAIRWKGVAPQVFGSFSATNLFTIQGGKEEISGIVIGPTCQITPTSLPAGTVGVAYSQTLTNSNCSSSTWSISSGSLPTGLSGCSSGSGTTCTITGTPTALGTSSFTAAYDTATDPLSITINLPPPNPGTVSVGLGVGSTVVH